MGDRWAMRHAPELSEPGEAGDVWIMTYDGADVDGSDCYGQGFASQCVAELNAQEATTDG